MSVDDFLNGGFMESESEGNEEPEEVCLLELCL